MDLKNDLAFQRAYNLKKHQKKLEEISKKKTKRLDNKLPDIFLNKKRKKGYDLIWKEYVVNKENLNLLNRLIEIKSKSRNWSKVESLRGDRREKEKEKEKEKEREMEKGEGLDNSTASNKTVPRVCKGKTEVAAMSVPRRLYGKLSPL